MLNLSLCAFVILSLSVASRCTEQVAQTDSMGGPFKKAQKVMGYYPAYHSELQAPAKLPWCEWVSVSLFDSRKIIDGFCFCGCKLALYTDVTFFVAIPELDGTFTYPPGLNSAKAETLAQAFVKEATSRKSCLARSSVSLIH